MTDEHIAREFLEKVALLRMDGMAIFTLTGIIRRVRTTERARCTAIAERIATDEQLPGMVSAAAQKIQAAILKD